MSAGMKGLEELKGRLRKLKPIPSGPVDGILGMLRNPDGPEAADRIATLEAEVVRLRGAIEPFARVAKRWDNFAPSLPDAAWMHIHINHPGTTGMDTLRLGDFRRSALAAGEG